jgi:hypothetical protein
LNVTKSSERAETLPKARIDFVRDRALRVCIGLQSLELDALQLCEILLFASGRVAQLILFHIWWKIATTVKHFRKHWKNLLFYFYFFFFLFDRRCPGKNELAEAHAVRRAGGAAGDAAGVSADRRRNDDRTA